jgi:hypothetical protein
LDERGGWSHIMRARSCLNGDDKDWIGATDAAQRAKKLVKVSGHVLAERTNGDPLRLPGRGTLGGFPVDLRAAK